MGVEICLSGWEVTGWCPDAVPRLLECCSRLLHASTGEWARQRILEKRFESDVPSLPGPLQPDWVNELLPLSAWKRRPYRIKITGKKRQYHLATSERASDHAGTIQGRLYTHPSPRIPGTFLIITVNGILQCLSGIRFPSINAQPCVWRQRSPNWSLLKHTISDSSESGYFMEGPFIKFLIQSHLDFHSILYLFKVAFFQGSQQETGKGKMMYSLSFLLNLSTVTCIYNQLWRAKNRIIFKKPTLLFSLFNVGMFTQFRMDWSDNE